MSIDPIPEPWHAFLIEVDNALEQETSFHCVGGFVVTVLYGSDRTTRDLDIIVMSPRDQRTSLETLAGKGSALHRRHGVYLDIVTIAKVPENYEERLTKMFPGRFERIRMYALDPYDIALAKIERNIERDRHDIRHLARTVPLDINILRQRYEAELRPDLFIPEREDLTLKLWIEMIEEDRSSE
jgi:hypothetical protein